MQSQASMTVQQRQVNRLWQRYAHLLALEQQAYIQEVEQLGESNIFLNVERTSNKTVDKGESTALFIEGIAQRTTLKEHLLTQWSWQVQDEVDLAAGELIISNLDQRGFHQQPLSELVNEKHSLPMLEQISSLIARLEPVGCGVNNWQESLWVQSQEAPLHQQWALVRMMDFCAALRFWQSGQWDDASALLGGVSEAVFREYLRQFSPYPGLKYADYDNAPLVTSLELYYAEDGVLGVNFNDELAVSRVDSLVLEQLMREISQDKDARGWVLRQWREAGNVVALHAYRKAQVIRIASWIANKQRKYLLKESYYLEPLELADVAKAVELSCATISRIIQHKELRYRHGVVRLKKLFSRKQQHRDRVYSQQEVLMKIKSYLYAYKGQKISDAKLTRLLALEGITLARRTVNKYRHLLKL